MEAPQEEIAEIHKDDAIALGAKNGIFFNRFFLPETYPLTPAPYQYQAVQLLDDPRFEYKALQIFRDGAKTTFARTRALKKICYGLSNTGLIVSDAQSFAEDSIDWIGRKVRENNQIRKIFGLEVGSRDARDTLEVINPLYKNKTTYKAKGMTGQLRGLNVADFRPDFILCDDPCNEENTGTVDQINKINNRFFGALTNTLTARSLNEISEIVLLQTILAKGDLIDCALKDSNFASLNISVFDKNGESAWPSKWSTEELLRKKQGFIDRGQLGIWLREKEGRLVDGTNSAFKDSWFHIYDDYNEIPEGSVYFLSVDPVPPPSSDEKIEQHVQRGDWEVWTVMALAPNGDYYFHSQVYNRGHQPDWSKTTFKELVGKFKPLAVGVETVAYQRVLLYLLKEAMHEERMFVRLHSLGEGDKRKKFNKITDTFSGIGYAGKVHIHRSCALLIEQITEYPYVQKDDHIDGAHLCVRTADDCYGGMIEEMVVASEQYEKQIPDLPEVDLCP